MKNSLALLRVPRYLAAFFLLVLLAGPASAVPVYWNVFNIEGESAVTAAIVTYGSLSDMVGDSNRTGTFNVGGVAGQNVVDSGSDGTNYWNVFNIEGESVITAAIVTYASLLDMVSDSNRTGTFNVGGAAGQNIVGAGSDGTNYWNVFNIEGESVITAAIVTYASLSDMVSDSNRTGTFNVGGAAGQNIVGAGSDGTNYWNAFNIEGESVITAAIVTYASLLDMVSDSNRTGTFNVGGAAGQNIVGSGASVFESGTVPPSPTTVPEPSSLLLLTGGLLLAALRRRALA